MKHRAARLDRRLGVLQDRQVRLVVAEEKLHVQADRQATRQDLLNLLHLGRHRFRRGLASCLWRSGGGGGSERGVRAGRGRRRRRGHGGARTRQTLALVEELEDLLQELLRRVVVQVEAELVQHQLVVGVAVVQMMQKVGHARSVVEEDEAARDRLVVRVGERAVQVDQDREHLAAELAAEHERVGDVERVGEHLGDAATALDRLLQHVQPARLERDADGLLELAVAEAALKHALDDVLQARVDRLAGVGRVGGLGLRRLERAVAVDALGDDCLCVQVLRGHVKGRARAECERERLVELTEVEVDLGRDERREAAPREALVLVQRLYAREGVGDLGPEGRDERVELLERVHLQLDVGLGEEADDAGGAAEGERGHPG
eukprot:Unigene6672_Nuclearia_a/m.20478 Unigene6672_Nuclearia_a/g.20478  ORF Unigene6672_Nuclearia_a/g.20478 Unigene6672_Nuclearia_a/m.20478 type:complete len:377 (+) Unigene6672_Nuclearia_a:795-1925(+)